MLSVLVRRRNRSGGRGIESCKGEATTWFGRKRRSSCCLIRRWRRGVRRRVRRRGPRRTRRGSPCPLHCSGRRPAPAAGPACLCRPPEARQAHSPPPSQCCLAGTLHCRIPSTATPSCCRESSSRETREHSIRSLQRDDCRVLRRGALPLPRMHRVGEGGSVPGFRTSVPSPP